MRPGTGPTPTRARAVTAAQRVGTVTAVERHRARIAGLALAAVTMMSIPAAALLDDADRAGARAFAGAAFVAIAALEVVVGWGIYVLLRERAHPPAYAALVEPGRVCGAPRGRGGSPGVAGRRRRRRLPRATGRSPSWCSGCTCS